MNRPATVGELRKSGYTVKGVKEELRENLIAKLKKNEVLFPGIVGYEKTVVPAIVNAILAKHDIILLGLRGQAKSRIIRAMVDLLSNNSPCRGG